MTFDKKTVAVIGAGPAGCVCAYYASKHNKKLKITVFDFAKPLHTLLYTGGGRCNLGYGEYDFKELVKFYPRGEKFLYSVFSQFSTSDAVKFFKEIGIETYTQDNLRIFPISNSAKDVREKLLNNMRNVIWKKEKVIEIIKKEELFLLKTENNQYYFDKVIIAIGGHQGFSLAENLGHTIVKPRPSLTGLVTKENFKQLQGLTLKNAESKFFFNSKQISALQDDLLFTHDGISGPLAYKISSICSRLEYDKNNPLIIKIKLINEDNNFQNLLNSNPKKDIKNLISKFIPKSFADYILKQNNINSKTKCFDINAATRERILNLLMNFGITVISPAKEGEIVTSGGICLDEINPKTMESKIVLGLYFCGEVINVDGFCGGFNLQNCWSTGFIAGNQLK